MPLIECHTCLKAVEEDTVLWVLFLGSLNRIDPDTGALELAPTISRTDPHDGSVPLCPDCLWNPPAE